MEVFFNNITLLCLITLHSLHSQSFLFVLLSPLLKLAILEQSLQIVIFNLYN